MVVAPCSMKSLAAMALGMATTCSRAADVTLKERRRLRADGAQTPFNLAHLRNMTAATEMGAVIFPPLPAFYHRPPEPRRDGRRHRRAVLALLGVDGAPARLGRAGRGLGCPGRPGAARSLAHAPNTAFGYCSAARLPL